MTKPWGYTAGWDVGQVNDPSALAVLEASRAPDPAREGLLVTHYACRHLERFPLGTDYVAQLKRVDALLRTPPLPGCRLAVDRTGVGRAPVDLLRGMSPPASVYGVTLTAGYQAAGERLDWNVPKRELAGLLSTLLHSGRLKIAESLPLAGVLTKELESFKVKVTLAGNETFEHWRERDHDDLVLAVGLAAWLGETFGGPQFLPAAGGVRSRPAPGVDAGGW